jgi:hypothetical protein
LKVAVTDVLEFIVGLQTVDVPEQAPDHPAKVEFAAGAAVRVTTVPALKVVPAGLVVTVPVPVPAFVIIREY